MIFQQTNKRCGSKPKECTNNSYGKPPSHSSCSFHATQYLERDVFSKDIQQIQVFQKRDQNQKKTSQYQADRMIKLNQFRKSSPFEKVKHLYGSGTTRRHLVCRSAGSRRCRPEPNSFYPSDLRSCWRSCSSTVSLSGRTRVCVPASKKRMPRCRQTKNQDKSQWISSVYSQHTRIQVEL